MPDYKIEYSYQREEKRTTEHDTSYNYTAQEAVDEMRRWYGDLPNLRIERVWIDRNNRWEITEAWE